MASHLPSGPFAFSQSNVFQTRTLKPWLWRSCRFGFEPGLFEIRSDLFFADSNSGAAMVWKFFGFDQAVDCGHRTVESPGNVGNFEKHRHIPFHKCFIGVFAGTKDRTGKGRCDHQVLDCLKSVTEAGADGTRLGDGQPKLKQSYESTTKKRVGRPSSRPVSIPAGCGP